MFTIKTLNAISPIIYEQLDKDLFTVDENAQAPDAILVRSAKMHDMPIPDSLLSVARAGAGYNNVPVDAMTQKGIVVFNTPGANANAVKELVVTGMLLASRDVISAIDWAKTLKGKGDDVPALVEKGKGQFVGPELEGKTLGVLGLGAIGGKLANLGTHLHMQVVGFDPFLSVENAWSLSRAVLRAPSQDALLAQADYLTVHVPLNADTKHTINADFLGKMKKGAVLLNFSRNELADNDAIKTALASGQLRKYVVDFPSDDLLGVDGVICIPHLGASTPESEENCAQMAAAQTRDYLLNGSIRNSVNLPALALDAPEAHRVAVIHQNVPTMLSQITTKLGEAGINISHMVNRSRNTIAYTVLDIDEAIPAAAAEALAKVEGIVRVRVIR